MTQDIDFSDTQIAFSHRSSSDLRQAYLLFKAFSNPILGRLGPSLTQTAFAVGLPIKGIVRKTIFKLFCGGETLSQCQPTISRLADQRIGTILDYGVEGLSNENGFNATARELERIIEFSAQHESIRFCVFKMTGIARFGLLERLAAGHQLSDLEVGEWQRVRDRVERLCQLARENQVRLMFDAEETWIQKPIDDLYMELALAYNSEAPVLYNTVQLYRNDRLEYLQSAHQHAESQGIKLGVKLVRGAYMEKERDRAAELGYDSPINPTKEATDRDFNLALKYVVAHLDDFGLVCGSHNEESTLYLIHLLEEQSIAKDDPRIEFSQLFGMSDHLTYNLVHHGFNVSKYVPYGPVEAVMPYLIRRADENSSVKGQTSRELDLISRELGRRRRQ